MITAETIIQAACTFYQIDRQSLMSRTRNNFTVTPRFACIAMMSKHLPKSERSSKRIAKCMGFKSHGSVLNGLRQCNVEYLGKAGIKKLEDFEKYLTSINSVTLESVNTRSITGINLTFQ